MKETLTVFLCSTYSDLVNERAEVTRAIQRLKLQHDSMEFFGARSGRAIETCLEEVRNSDLLVVIVAHRYGSLVPGEKISYSEAEYREGHRLGRPCLVYMLDPSVAVRPSNYEDRPGGIRALRRFRRQLEARHTVASFTDPHDLALKVTVDITRSLEALGSARPPAAPGADPPARLESLWEEAAASGMDPAELQARVRRMIADLQVAGRRRPARVFLSYAQADRHLVRAFAEGLRREGAEVLDEARGESDESIVDQISRGLDTADFVVFFMSAVSLGRRLTTIELNYAIAHRLSSAGGARIVPVLLDDVAVPSVLRADNPPIDLRDRDVARAVAQMMGHVRHVQAGPA